MKQTTRPTTRGAPEMAAEVAGTAVAKVPFSRNYKLLMINASMSRTGTSGFQLAVLWMALVITNSPVLAGFADGMAVLPLFFSFVFGAYVDRLASKKVLAVAVSIARAVSILAIFLALLINNLLVETLSIYFVAFVIGMSTDILNSTRASWSKQFLEMSQYQSGVSLSQSISAVAEGIGYGVSGLLILMGLQFAVYSFVIIFAVSIVPILMLRNERTESISQEKSMQSSVVEGMKFVFGDSRLRGLVIIILVLNLAFGTIGIFTAYLVDMKFGLPAIFYTTLALSITSGILVGSAVGSKAKGKVGFYSIALILPMGVILYLLGFLDSIFPDFAILFIGGIFLGVLNVVVNTAVLHIVSQEMMGRVSGTFNTFGLSLTFLSGAIGGVLIQLLSLQWAFVFVGSIIMVASFLPLAFRDFYNLTV